MKSISESDEEDCACGVPLQEIEAQPEEREHRDEGTESPYTHYRCVDQHRNEEQKTNKPCLRKQQHILVVDGQKTS